MYKFTPSCILLVALAVVAAQATPALAKSSRKGQKQASRTSASMRSASPARSRASYKKTPSRSSSLPAKKATPQRYSPTFSGKQKSQSRVNYPSRNSQKGKTTTGTSRRSNNHRRGVQSPLNTSVRKSVSPAMRVDIPVKVTNEMRILRNHQTDRSSSGRNARVNRAVQKLQVTGPVITGITGDSLVGDLKRGNNNILTEDLRRNIDRINAERPIELGRILQNDRIRVLGDQIGRPPLAEPRFLDDLAGAIDDITPPVDIPIPGNEPVDPMPPVDPHPPTCDNPPWWNSPWFWGIIDLIDNGGGFCDGGGAVCPPAPCPVAPAPVVPPAQVSYYLGFRGNQIPQIGFAVQQVDPQSPAQMAGIQSGDIILGVGQERMTGPDLIDAYLSAQAGVLDLLVVAPGDDAPRQVRVVAQVVQAASF